MEFSVTQNPLLLHLLLPHLHPRHRHLHQTLRHRRHLHRLYLLHHHPMDSGTAPTRPGTSR
jgi:hypothetical protein